MLFDISISSIDAFSSDEKAALCNEEQSLVNELAVSLAEEKSDGNGDPGLADDNESETSEVSSFIVNEDLDEENPPLKAVQGFRPMDYTVADFYPGVHIKYARRKQGPWLEGLVVGTEGDDSTLVMEIRFVMYNQTETGQTLIFVGRWLSAYCVIQKCNICNPPSPLPIIWQHISSRNLFIFLNFSAAAVGLYEF